MDLDFNEMSYPDTIAINDCIYRAKRDISKSIIMIPYTQPPEIEIGDIIVQKTSTADISLRVLDISMMPGGTLNIGTPHANLLKAKIENMTAEKYRKPDTHSTVNIGSLNAQQVQVGNNNSLNITISLETLVKEVLRSGDEDAKGKLRKLLENSTVGSLIGAGASTLLGLF